jgi:phenylacetate-CoA ligase
MKDNQKYWNKELETMRPANLQSRQIENLKSYIKFSYDNSAYYRRIMGNSKMKPTDLQRMEDYYEAFPFLDKKSLIEEQLKQPPFGDFLTVDPAELARLYVAPGPVYLPYTDEDYRRVTNLFASAFYTNGARQADIVDVAMIYHWAIAGTVVDDAFREIGAAVIPAGPGQSKMHVETLKNTKATVLYAFTSFVGRIEEVAREMGLNPKEDFSLRLAIIVGEVRSEETKQLLGRNLNVDVREVYGTTELGLIAAECEACAGMHLHPDTIFETIDPATGKHLPFGEAGEIVATSFATRALPVIRYRTGDLVGPLDMEPCPCGRTTPKMSRILGRSSDIAKVKGIFIVPRQVENVVSKFPELGRFQIIVDHPKTVDTLSIMVEYKEKIDRKNLAQLLAKDVKEAIKLTAEIQLVNQGTIPEDAGILDDRRKI